MHWSLDISSVITKVKDSLIKTVLSSPSFFLRDSFLF